jgi:hypothetical protein
LWQKKIKLELNLFCQAQVWIPIAKKAELELNRFSIIELDNGEGELEM